MLHEGGRSRKLGHILRPYPWPWTFATREWRQVAVKVTRAAVYVGGRYRKLGRNISNSPWIPGKCVTSVQEELERWALPGMRSDICKFMSAGEPYALDPLVPDSLRLRLGHQGTAQHVQRHLQTLTSAGKP